MYNPPVKIKPDTFIKSLVSKAYPNYSGRKFRLQVSEDSLDVRSYWDEGSREYFTFANLATGEVSSAVPAQSAYDRKISGADSVELPTGFACIKHAIFCGHDTGITIIVRPENAAKLLTAVQS